LFWIHCVPDVGERFIPGKLRRIWLAVIAAVVYVFFCAYSFTHFGILHQWHLHRLGRTETSGEFSASVTVITAIALTVFCAGFWLNGETGNYGASKPAASQRGTLAQQSCWRMSAGLFRFADCPEVGRRKEVSRDLQCA